MFIKINNKDLQYCELTVFEILKLWLLFSFIFRYRWAFVGDAASGGTENNNLSSDFVPHITRIAKLMDLKVRIRPIFIYSSFFINNIVFDIRAFFGKYALLCYLIKNVILFAFATAATGRETIDDIRLVTRKLTEAIRPY